MEGADIQRTHHYLSGQLSPEERQVFEQSLQKDSDLSDELNTQMLIRLGRHLALREQIQSIAASEMPLIAHARKRRRASYSISGIAAGILLLIGFWNSFQPADSLDLYKAHFEPFPISANTLQQDQELFGIASDLYQKGLYQESLIAFGKLDSLSVPQQQEVAFYQAVALIALNKADQAISSLEVLTQQVDSPYAILANYYLGMALLIKEAPDEALAQFQKVKENNPPYPTIMEHNQALIEALE